MLAAYRSSGGLAREAEVLAYIEHHCSADDGKLARSIADKHVISFEWQSQTWLPWFQFDRSDMSLQRGMAPVLAELNVVYDAWELAHWFARPNASLSQRAPADALALNFDAVLCTARADRFVNA